jgi:hypothetical protein
MHTDWTKFTKRIPIKTELSRVYKTWCTQQELENWFLRKAEFIKPNNSLRTPDEEFQKDDKYLWLWHGHSDNVFEKKEILEANGNDLIQFGFTADCIVTVKLYTLEGETIVELTQDNIPPDNNPATNLHIGCGEGWTFYLANLKSYLEGGIDLRNKNEKIQGVINS